MNNLLQRSCIIFNRSYIMYYIKLFKRSYSTYKPCRLFKIVRICIIDHEIISPDIDGSCHVYSSLKFVYTLAENGLLICVFI